MSVRAEGKNLAGRSRGASAPAALARRGVLKLALGGAVAAPALAGATRAVASPHPAQALASQTVESAELLQQSPIDIRLGSVTTVSGLPQLKVRYSTDTSVRTHYVSKDEDQPLGCSIRGHEETEETEVEPGAGDVVLDGVTYHLVQFHFHTPSEHLVQGRAAPLEQHLVHQSDDGRLLVIGVLLTAGPADEVDRVLADLPNECGRSIDVHHFNLRKLLPVNLATVRYQGSLTTAPFTEGVQWFLTVPQTVSAAGIRAFQTVFPEGDSRPVQPLNDRRILADVRWSPGWSR